MIRPSVPEYVIDKYSLTELQRVPGSIPGSSPGTGMTFWGADEESVSNAGYYSAMINRASASGSVSMG
jgi:hypothetical protein